MNGWRPHPAAELFPLLGDDELRGLAGDIAEHGLREPVWLYDDPQLGTVLLDGRNRAAACQAAGVPVATRLYTGDDPIGFSISLNLTRRHLTAGQRAAVGATAELMYAAEAKRRQAHGETAPGKPKASPTLGADRPQALSEEKVRGPRARDRAAAATGASGRVIQRFKRVANAAPDLAEKVKAGTMSIDRAERIVRDREAEARRVAEAKADAARQPEPCTVDLREGDFRHVLADLRDVDAIITDPPYPAEYLPLLDDLAAWADRVLAPDGVLVVLIGQTHLPEVYHRLDGHRPYRWTGCYLTPGNAYVSHPRKVASSWKPLLVYGAGPRVSDVVRSEGSDTAAKDHHKWGQNYQAFHTLVERFTRPGQTVVDPFAGSGTTLLAAHALGRHAIGADIDPDAAATARKRLS